MTQLRCSSCSDFESQLQTLNELDHYVNYYYKETDYVDILGITSLITSNVHWEEFCPNVW